MRNGNSTLIWILLGLLALGGMLFAIFQLKNQISSPFSSPENNIFAPKQTFQKLLKRPSETPIPSPISP